MQPSFAAGEFSPAMRRRIDFAKYAVGADTLENLIVLPQGGFQARAGTKKIAAVKNSVYKSRIVRFVFSLTQAYVLEFGNYYMRVYMDGGVVCSSGTTPYELATPYPIADVWSLKFEQSADVLFVTHPKYQERRITRLGHANWTISTTDFKSSPLMQENSTGTTITLSNASASQWLAKDSTVNVTASTGIFNAGHVGSIWGIRYRAFTQSSFYSLARGAAFDSDWFRVIGNWTVTVLAGEGDINNSPLIIWKSIDGGTTWFKIKTIPASITNGSSVEAAGSESDECLIKITKTAADDGGTVTVDIAGQYSWACFKIATYSSPTSVTAVMQHTFSGGSIAYKTWAEAAWSDYRGWPRAATFFQNRWLHGGTEYGPNSYWASLVDDYSNNTVSIDQVEDEAISDRLPSREVNAIEWLVPTQDLLVLTGDSEWTISPSSTTGVFSYKQKIVHQRTANGCSGNVKPAVIGDTVVFLKKNANKVQGLSYSDSNGYVSTELSVLADHLFSGYTIVDWAYQQCPNSILWCVRSDGALLSFTYMREQDVWAWSHHYTDGQFESVAVIPGDVQDDVYLQVKRLINGSYVRYVEMMAARDTTSEDTYCGLDCSADATYPAGTTTISGLGYLEGKQVKVIADGIDVGLKTVTNGAIALNKSANHVRVGLDFTWLFKSLSIDSSVDTKKVISSVTVSVIDSQGGEAGTEIGGMFNKLPYPGTDLYTGDLVDIVVPSSPEYDGRVVLRGSGASPFWCIAVTPKVTRGGN